MSVEKAHDSSCHYARSHLRALRPVDSRSPADAGRAAQGDSARLSGFAGSVLV